MFVSAVSISGFSGPETVDRYCVCSGCCPLSSLYTGSCPASGSFLMSTYRSALSWAIPGRSSEALWGSSMQGSSLLSACLCSPWRSPSPEIHQSFPGFFRQVRQLDYPLRSELCKLEPEPFICLHTSTRSSHIFKCVREPQVYYIQKGVGFPLILLR